MNILYGFPRVILIMLFCLVPISLPAYRGGGMPLPQGGTGIATVPSAATIGRGIDLGLHFVGTATGSVSLGVGIIKELDISLALEGDGEGDRRLESPYLHFRSKFRFHGNGYSDSWAAGFRVDHAAGPLGGNQPTRFSLFVVNSYAPRDWQFAWGGGYTFQSEESARIDFFIGLSRLLLSEVGDFGGLYLEIDYANHSLRGYQGSHLNNDGGVGNVLLRSSFFRGLIGMAIGLYDCFDGNRRFGFSLCGKFTF